MLSTCSLVKAAESHARRRRRASELVNPHLALAVKDAPEPLAVDADTTTQFGDADAAAFAQLLIRSTAYFPQTRYSSDELKSCCLDSGSSYHHVRSQ